MHCGCPLPVNRRFRSHALIILISKFSQGDTVGQKLSRLIHSHRNPVNPPNRDDCLLATHPSDHNSVYISGVSHGLRHKRMVKMQTRRTRDLKKVKAGKLDERMYRRGDTHNNAFLVPIPMYYPGLYTGYGGACAAVRKIMSEILSFSVLMVLQGVAGCTGGGSGANSGGSGGCGGGGAGCGGTGGCGM